MSDQRRPGGSSRAQTARAESPNLVLLRGGQAGQHRSYADEETGRGASSSREDERRLAADVRLFAELKKADFTGPLWTRVKEELASYAIRVLMAWLNTGRMFAEVARVGRNVGEKPRHWTSDDQSGLAHETVARALVTFHRRALVAGEYDPRHGASLKTYFIGTCRLEFPNVYRKWQTEGRHRKHEHLSERSEVDQELELHSTGSSGPDSDLLSHLSRGQILGTYISDERTRRVVLLRAEGYSNRAIAELLNETLGAVEGLLRRLRKTMDGMDDSEWQEDFDE